MPYRWNRGMLILLLQHTDIIRWLYVTSSHASDGFSLTEAKCAMMLNYLQTPVQTMFENQYKQHKTYFGTAN